MKHTVVKLKNYLEYIDTKNGSYFKNEKSLVNIDPNLCNEIIDIYGHTANVSNHFHKYFDNLENILKKIDTKTEGKERFLDKLINNFCDIYETNRENSDFSNEIQKKYLDMIDFNQVNKRRFNLLAIGTGNTIMLEKIKNHVFSQEEYLFGCICEKSVTYQHKLHYSTDLEYALIEILLNQSPEHFKKILHQTCLEDINKIKELILLQSEECIVYVVSTTNKILRKQNLAMGLDFTCKYEQYLILEKELPDNLHQEKKMKI